VIVEIPATGERIEARLIQDNDPSVPLSITLGPSGRVAYVVANMLAVGWRIVECTPAERAIMEAHGIALID
jgi:hypothetical protein